MRGDLLQRKDIEMREPCSINGRVVAKGAVGQKGRRDEKHVLRHGIARDGYHRIIAVCSLGQRHAIYHIVQPLSRLTLLEC